MVLDHYLDALQALEETDKTEAVTGKRVRQRVAASEVVSVYPEQGVVSEAYGQLIVAPPPPKMAVCRPTSGKSAVSMPVLGEAMQAERGLFSQEEVDVARAAALRLAHQHPECASGPEGYPHDTSPPSPCAMQ